MSDAANTVTVMYGNCSFPSWSIRGHALVMVKSSQSGLHEGKFAGHVLERIGQPKVKQADIGGSDLNGSWSIDNLKAKNGTIIALGGRLTRNGSLYANAKLFIILRDTGPLMRVNLKMPPQHDSSFADSNALPIFYGRGDVLKEPVDDLFDLGISIPANFVKGELDQEDIDILFDIVELKKGQPKPEVKQIQTDAGTVVTVAKGPRRRVRIQRR